MIAAFVLVSFAATSESAAEDPSRSLNFLDEERLWLSGRTDRCVNAAALALQRGANMDVAVNLLRRGCSFESDACEQLVKLSQPTGAAFHHRSRYSNLTIACLHDAEAGCSEIHGEDRSSLQWLAWLSGCLAA